MHFNAFAHPREHVRLLSDARRNRAMIDTVVRHSPGQRVLEVGCGTGLLSVIAARAGARRVYAVEATDMFYVARDLVRRNALQDVVEVVPGMIEDLDPQPVDFAFSELLHADPFTEGVVDASNAMATWLVDGGRMAPTHLTVFAALAVAAGPEWEAHAALAELAVHAATFDLDLGAVEEVLRAGSSLIENVRSETPMGPPVAIYQVALGDGSPLPGPVEHTLEITAHGPISGVMFWFVARMDEHTLLGNTPDAAGHWGQHICAFGRTLEGRPGQRVRVRFELHGKALVAELVD